MGDEKSKSEMISSSESSKTGETAATNKLRENPTSRESNGSSSTASTMKAKSEASKALQGEPQSQTPTATTSVTVVKPATGKSPSKSSSVVPKEAVKQTQSKSKTQETRPKLPLKNSTQVSADSKNQKTNTGNDRVTVDKAKKPLVPTPKQNSSKQLDSKKAPSTSTAAKAKAIAPVPSVSSSGTGTSSKTSATSKPTASTSTSASKSTSTSTAASATPAKSVGMSSTKTSTPAPRPSGTVAGLPGTVPTTPSGGSVTSKPKKSTVSTSVAPTKSSSGSAVASTPKVQCTTPSATSASPAPGAVVRTPLGAVAVAPSCVVSPPVIMDEQTLLEEKIKKERSPLTDKYGSFIIISDTRLEDARSRLRTAIEQTRQLRRSFTERVYGKYRVCLHPPASTEQILTRILQDPSGAAKDLNLEIARLRREKEIEKKEAQTLSHEMALAAASTSSETPSTPATVPAPAPAPSATPTPSASDSTVPAKPGDANSSPTTTKDTPSTTPTPASSPTNPLAAVNAENADQLMYVSAGLSLIVLPEQDTAGIDMSPYTDRAPTNPATGQRVKSISAAAAAAGEVMLDRARKGGAMRAERRRRHQLAGSGKDSTEIDTSYSRLSILTNPSLTAPPPIPVTPAAQAPSVSKTDTKTSSLPHSNIKSSSSSISPKSPSLAAAAARSTNSAATKKASSKTPGASTPSNLPAATAKAIRARVQATMSVQTLLSLSPSTEELRPDGKISAATLALMERGVGTHGQNAKAHNQQRYRHPFPESLGARRRTIQASNHPSAKQDALLHPAYASISLPPTPTTKERRNCKRVSNLISNSQDASSQRSKHAIGAVLRRFTSSGTKEDSSRPPHKKQRLAEISFLHGLRQEEPPKAIGQTTRSVSDSATQASPIDPMLALHVMQATGLIKPSQSLADGMGERTEPTFPNTLDTELFAVAERRAFGGEGGTTHRSVQTLKRFFEDFKAAREKTFSSAFCTQSKATGDSSGSDMEEEISRRDGPDLKNSHVVPKAPVLDIRGGGEAVKKTSDKANGKNKDHANEKRNSKSGSADSTVESNAKASSTLGSEGATSSLWNGTPRQSLVLLNPSLQPGQPPMMHQNGSNALGSTGRMGGPMNGTEHYHPNAIQLANQLRLSRMSQQGSRGTGDLTDYIGSLHPQSPPTYDWSSIGAASAAAVASAQSLAALGISPHRAAMVNFPLQDRARAIMRDQQNAAAAAQAAAAHRHQQQALAYLSGGHGYPAGPASAFAHLNGAMLNPSSFLGQAGMPQGTPGVQLPAPRSGKKRAENGTRATSTSNETDAKPATSKSKNQQSSENSTEKARGAAVENEGGKSSAGEKTKDGKKRKTEDEGTPSAKRPKQTDDVANNASEGIDDGAVSNLVKGSQGDTSSHVKDRSEGASSRSTISSTRPSTDTYVARQNGKDKSLAERAKAVSHDRGLKFFVPPAPLEVSTTVATLVLEARCEEAVDAMSGSEVGGSNKLLAYISAVGSAVPIPKALVAAVFKEKFMGASTKIAGMNNIPQSSREVTVASILLWLWKNHEACFQDAFAKSGRIDVDPTCKWLIVLAVEKSIEAIAHLVETAVSKPGAAFSIAFAGVKAKGSTLKESEKIASNVTLDLQVSASVSSALIYGMRLDGQMDPVVLNFNKLLDYLDEMRKNALYSKSQERALLAALISRKATMSLPFSHAYVSSVVRAGEALGHGELFEVVQNEEVNVSTKIPYDVFTDESGAWEDPCRPLSGFNSNLTGDDLMRRAHARAMMQKSLKKLQDRHNIKGGTAGPGAYIDPPSSGSNSSDPKSANTASSTTPRGWLKRRSSFSEPPVQPGTGSAVATSWNLYEPKHVSAPLAWDANDIQNAPYGRHESGTRPRSLSLSQFAVKQSGRGRGRQSARSMSFAAVEPLQDSDMDDGPMKRSTREIPWVRVAGIFQNVALSGSTKSQEISAKKSQGQTIFAPFVRQVQFDDLDSSSEEESDTEEDLSAETVLRKHQVGLDKMKEHLSSFLEARRKSNDKKKSRTLK